MRIPRWALPVAVQVVLVPSVLAAGVTSAVLLQPDAPSRGVVAQAVSRVTAVGTYRSTFAVTIKGAGGLSVVTSGSTLVDTGRGLMTGELVVPTAGSLQLRQVGERGYIGLPGGRTDAQGHHWLGITSGGAGSVGAQDPLAMLRTLGGDADVRELGHEEVSGVDTTHYDVDVDIDALIALAQKQGAVPQNLPEGLADKFENAHADLWIDEDDLPRRLVMAYRVENLDFSVECTFADFGGSVSVTEPSASDVTLASTPLELQSLLQQALLTR